MSTRCAFISSRPNSKTANSPHGPAPMISTSVLIASLISLLFGLDCRPPAAVLPGLSSQHGRGMEAHIAGAAYLARTSESGRWAKRAFTPCGHSRTALVRTQIAEIAAVNAPARLGSTPRLEDFPYRLTDNVRFADLDPNQHVNNAVYATYFRSEEHTSELQSH